jgi:serine/threonine protein phosphatase PrpC
MSATNNTIKSIDDDHPDPTAEQLFSEAAAADDDDDGEAHHQSKGHTFRKRRLSLTLQKDGNPNPPEVLDGSIIRTSEQFNGEGDDDVNDEDEADEDEADDDDEEDEDDAQSHTLHIQSSENFHSPISYVGHHSTAATTGLHLDSSNHTGGNGTTEIDEKAHTFRKRRLSLTTNDTNETAPYSLVSSSLSSSPSNTATNPVTSSTSTMLERFSTTTATTTTTTAAAAVGGGSSRKSELRRLSIDSHSSIASSSICSNDTYGNHHNGNHPHPPHWISRTLHSGELIGTDGTLPPSPAHGPSFSTHFLYHPTTTTTTTTTSTSTRTLNNGATTGGTAQQQQQQHPPSTVTTSPPQHPPVLELGSTAVTTTSSEPRHATLNGSSTAMEKETKKIPKWKRRRTFDDRNNTDHHHKLPFSRDVVGTYSCHGVEPVYSNDDVYEEDEWNVSHDGHHNSRHMMALPVTVAKINQDRGGVVYPYRNHPRTALFAVYDGHGHGGELVSQFALYEIQRRLEKHPLFDVDIERAMKETFLAVDDALIDEPSIDPMFAGTTACVVLMQNQRLTIANAGDSRAVCARRKSSTSSGTPKTAAATNIITAADMASLFPYMAIDLSFDQNPDVPTEMARIQKAGGYVSLPPGPGLSARVWMDPRCTQVGLAMSRSIGDHAISTVGVIAEPVVTYHDITDEDEFFIVASDGVWEFLDSTEAVNIVGNNLHRGSTKACQALIEAAAARWYEEEGAYRDDITAIVVRLKEIWKKPENGKKV